MIIPNNPALSIPAGVSNFLGIMATIPSKIVFKPNPINQGFIESIKDNISDKL
jgi:hypothetical protein